jgi:V-type H+-transporting ATPase subunit B
MAGDEVDPRMMSVKPRLRYNTIGGVNGPLVILENVRIHHVILGAMRMKR